ncbi:hypothetical protein CerSpe_184350 [Prunus speciosa]
MRPLPPPRRSLELSAASQEAEFGLVHLSPSLSSSPPPTRQTTCVSHTCRWWPYSGSKEFEANAAMVIIILLSALICALGLNAAIRCFLRGRGSDNNNSPRDNDDNSHLPQTQQELVQAQQKSNVAGVSCLEGAPELFYSAAMKARLAGAEAECAICLSEFVEGEGIRVLGRCKHGFHTHCIQEWLSSHSSCPTCRRTCLPPSPPPSPPQPGTDNSSQQIPAPESGP